MPENEETWIFEAKMIVEQKSVEKVHPTHNEQVLTHLCLTGIKLEYLLNFGEALTKDGSVAPCLCENQERANKAVLRSEQPTEGKQSHPDADHLEAGAGNPENWPWFLL
jgi:hypothetical protein